MTRKHFIELARNLHDIKPKMGGFHKLSDYDIAHKTWALAVTRISAVCAGANANFNGHRFEAACLNGIR